MHPLRLLAAATAAVPLLASAGCSRPITVPVSPIGQSIRIDKDGQISGVFPALMRDIGAKTGCEIRMSEVPRARLEMMFEQGHADMLLAATHAERRDKYGQFVPLIQTRAVLMSLDHQRAPIKTMAELAARPELKLVLVRGFDYGPAYNALSRRLQAAHRLVLAKDPLEVARMLQSRIADVTIMPASGLYGAAKADPRTASIAEQFRVEPLEELPWGLAGVYLSTQSLTADDRAVLESGLNAAAKAGALYHAYKGFYPANIFAFSSRPL
ncbi:transporter substrate-binding domain-containing protein [Massilia arenosa]|uniref:Transporter substrate-binding domain-containing protein n=1 Tax=Zemynaea arenosa TaxID=2561931 RepID=A0A4Y9SGQ9_9BURK|nr:transporter substrate-binding domain-containing protein [Massilia arenosa]TFW22763.1 transporter substrate-binding domain-containing protein [Massilia arenosa]